MVSIVYGGLDTHKDSIEAYLFCPETGEVVRDRIANTREAVTRAVRRWRKLGTLDLCYEASGAGFVLYRWLTTMQVACSVIAPSLIPKAPGNRVKTDRRDAAALAHLHAAGMLSAIRVPSPEEEEIRAVVRLHDMLTQDLVRTKNRISKHLRLLGHRFSGKTSWSKAYRAWLAQLPLSPTAKLILDSHLEELDRLLRRRTVVDQTLAQIAEREPYRTLVRRLVCLRGVQRYTALVLITELGDVRRFGRAPEVMSYAGLVPRESSSGERRRTGAITKAGNRHLRWILAEAAWNQVRRPRPSARRTRARQDQPAEVVAIAQRAEERLHKTFWRIAVRKDRRTAATAVARELVGFVWAILRADAA